LACFSEFLRVYTGNGNFSRLRFSYVNEYISTPEVCSEAYLRHIIETAETGQNRSLLGDGWFPVSSVEDGLESGFSDG
jgi:hypothetical protein